MRDFAASQLGRCEMLWQCRPRRYMKTPKAALRLINIKFAIEDFLLCDSTLARLAIGDRS